MVAGPHAAVGLPSAADRPPLAPGRRSSGMARRLRGFPIVSAALIGLFVLLALFGEAIAPHSAYRGELLDRLLPPMWAERGNPSFPLGTDPLGRDTLSRLIVGTRVSLSIAVATVGLGAIVGTLLGLLAGYFGGWVDILIMRFADIMFALPFILIALLAVVVVGPGAETVIVVLAVVLWARFARLIRSEVLSWKQREFVEAARTLGCTAPRIIFRHILPNVVNTVIVFATLHLGWVVVVEAVLSFLGAGVPQPTPAWGGMVAAGQQFVFSAWWLSVVPGTAIAVLVLAFNLLGDWLRERFDPRRREPL